MTIFNATKSTGPRGRKYTRQFVITDASRGWAFSGFYVIGPHLLPAPHLTVQFKRINGRYVEVNANKYGYTQDDD